MIGGGREEEVSFMFHGKHLSFSPPLLRMVISFSQNPLDDQ